MLVPFVRLGLVVLCGAAGVLHLVDPALFHPVVPNALAGRDLLIRATGVPFLMAAGGLLAPPRLRRFAALGLIVLLIGVWPGNWWGALQPGSYLRPGASNVVDWLRVPLQLPLIALAYWSNRDVWATGARSARIGGAPFVPTGRRRRHR